ncbi:hypothetical protein [Planococcus shenhongbingii]|uniref:Uncharacterized protein n=1 Tax=Planococcus shenhongbingii TaxID=3058398 RepID=A0ABT8NAH2_9BACL|nr:hypothetical protein [Planococcus sp. N017]MDN7244550.1 hypothetical protein [Planococcus sp. N017]
MKKFLLLLGILLICGAGYLIYLFGFKDYNVADAEVDILTKEEYVIELADGSKIILDKNGNLLRHLQEGDEAVKTEKFRKGMPYSESSDLAVASVTSENTKTGDEKDSAAKGTDSKTGHYDKASNSAKSQKEGITVKDIEKKYEPAIADIERQANNSLNNLIDLAKNEYLEMEANDQKISYPYFYNKYSAAASKLEKRTDQIFYAVMDIMEQDLKSKNLPTSLSDTLSKKYESRKAQLRKDILKQTAGL